MAAKPLVARTAALAAFVLAAAFTARAAGLTVDADGTLRKDGHPYRGIGINYFSALSRNLADADDTSYREGFAELSRRGIPFIRFMAGGFWPNDWKLYFDDREAYFRRFEAFVEAAEEYGIGLVPSLLWHIPAAPDLMGEPQGKWGDPSSKTVAFMREYVGAVVERYADSPAIWAWELGNEYNLAADLPNAADHRPQIVPRLGTPTSRSEADDVTHDMIVTAFTEFAKEVRRHDAHRLITTGNSIPRPAAHHMRIELSWTHDTRDEFTANLLAVTPEPVNMISIHVYPHARKRFGGTASYEEILSLAMATARKTGKVLFVGEFGASDTEEAGGIKAARKDNEALLDAIMNTDVPLAALWVFDLPMQESFINVTPTNHRAYLLDALEEANRALGAR